MVLYVTSKKSFGSGHISAAAAEAPYPIFYGVAYEIQKKGTLQKNTS
jgi:hypothetical protein